MRWTLLLTLPPLPLSLKDPSLFAPPCPCPSPASLPCWRRKATKPRWWGAVLSGDSSLAPTPTWTSSPGQTAFSTRWSRSADWCRTPGRLCPLGFTEARLRSSGTARRACRTPARCFPDTHCTPGRRSWPQWWQSTPPVRCPRTSAARPASGLHPPPTPTTHRPRRVCFGWKLRICLRRKGLRLLSSARRTCSWCFMVTLWARKTAGATLYQDWTCTKTQVRRFLDFR